MEDLTSKKRKFIIGFIYFFIIGLIAYVSLKYLIPLISPFIVAFIIALFLRKPSRWLSKKLKVPLKITTFVFVLLFYSIIGVIVSLAGIKLISIISDIVKSMPDIYIYQIEPFLMDIYNVIEKSVYQIDPGLVNVLYEGFTQFVESLNSNISDISIALLTSISENASQLPIIFVRVLITFISTFFIAIDFELLTSFVYRQLSEKANAILSTIKSYMSNTLLVVIRSYALIMCVTFCELSIGLTWIGVENSILIAVLIAIFDVLPVLGTGGIMIPWTIITFLQGDMKMGVSLLALYIFVTVMRNILEPKIVGQQLGIHPIVALTAMFVGANLFGVLGLFGFPISLSLIKHLNETHTLSIFK